MKVNFINEIFFEMAGQTTERKGGGAATAAVVHPGVGDGGGVDVCLFINDSLAIT